MNICVLASTNGTDLQAILEEIKAGKMKGIELKFVLTDKAKCGAAEKAKAAGVACVFLDPIDRTDLPLSTKLGQLPQTPLSRQKSGHLPLAGETLLKRGSAFRKLTRDEYDRMVAEVCEAYEVDLVVLVGWMRLFGANFVRKFKRRIINVHPSLLPKYPGMDLNVHRAVLDSGDSETGMTIHYVDEGMDTGEIILQKKTRVEVGESVDSLKKKVQALECKHYPQVIRDLAMGMAN